MKLILRGLLCQIYWGYDISMFYFVQNIQLLTHVKRNIENMPEK